AYLRTWRKRALAASPASAVVKPYLQMSEAEQLAFIDTQEQRISAMMGDRPAKLNEKALRAIKTSVDRYAARQESRSMQAGAERLTDVYDRAGPYVPIISRAFSERRIPIIVGIYLPMIESEYKPCFENSIGAKGLFQFLPQTVEQYGVRRTE